MNTKVLETKVKTGNTLQLISEIQINIYFMSDKNIKISYKRHIKSSFATSMQFQSIYISQYQGFRNQFNYLQNAATYNKFRSFKVITLVNTKVLVTNVITFKRQDPFS